MLHQVKILRSRTFKQLVDVSSKIILEMNPVNSSQMGNPMHNNLWPDISDKGVKKDIEVISAIKQKLDELTINMSEKEDASLLDWFMDVNLFELEELRLWEHTPYLSSVILGGILSIIQQDYDSDSRLHSIFARLSSIITIIRGEQRRLIKPVKLWVNAEQKSLEQLIDYLHTLPDYFPEIDEEKSIIFADNIDEAADLLRNHIKWLQNLECSEKLPTDKQKFEKLFFLRRLGMNTKDLKELGREYLEKTEDQLTLLVEQLNGSSVEQIRKEIRRDHATTFDQVVSQYKDLAKKAKSLIVKKDLITMPDERLEVIFTPDPLRNFLSIAAARPPGRYAKNQTGYFYCTPHADKSMLEEHSYAYQPLLMSHESYPGHHIHGVCKNTHPSLVRSNIFVHPSANTGIMYSSKLAEMTEGWGLYCEKMMYDHGFENDPNNPNLKQKFLQINALRWRATRVIIDTKLHSGEMGYDEAVQFLIDQTGYNKTTAKAEVLMYSKSPGYFSSYLLGRHLILQLKTKTMEKLSEKEFHDKIIYAGNVPYWFVENNVFE